MLQGFLGFQVMFRFNLFIVRVVMGASASSVNVCYISYIG
jgi:hypothetical protein